MTTNVVVRDLPDFGQLPPELRQLQEFLEAMRQATQTRDPSFNRVGSALDKFVTRRELVGVDLLEYTSGGSFVPGPATGGEVVVDTTAPANITGLFANSGFNGAFVGFDVPSYTAGGGNAYTKIYAANYSGTGPLPTFGSAVWVQTVTGTQNLLFDPVTPGTHRHYWAAAVTRGGIEQATPTGGTNGVAVDISLSPGPLLDMLNDQITESQLHATLSARIDMIDAGTGMKRLYGFDTGTDGWTPSNATFTAANGVGTWTPTTSNGSLGRGMSVPERYTGSDMPFIRMRVRRVSGTGTWEGNLYYTSLTLLGFSNSFRKQIDAPLDPDKWNLLEWDMHELTAGSTDYMASIITGLAVDLVSDTGSVWEIDWIGLGENSETATSVQIDHLSNQYTVRAEVTAGGRTVVGGFGISGSATDESGPSIDFGVVANKFWIGPPASATGLTDVAPFVVQTTDQTVNGVLIPKGVYMDAAYIKNLTAMVARLGTLWVDNAMIADLSVVKLTTGSLAVGADISSNGFSSGSTGWRIQGNGSAEFAFTMIRGTLQAGQIAASFITTNEIQVGATHVASNGTATLTGVNVPAGVTDYTTSNTTAVTQTMTGKPVTVEVQVEIEITCVSTVKFVQLEAYLVADGTDVAFGVCTFPYFGALRNDTFPIVFRHTPSAASHNYGVRWRVTWYDSTGANITTLASQISFNVSAYFIVTENKV